MHAALDRRSFLRRTFAFSALATPLARAAHALAPGSSDPHAHHALIFGDWGYEKHHEGQQQVAAAMQRYAAAQKLNVEALLMLGDSWYGELPGGVEDPRWKTQFEDMYPASVFACPAYSVMGNHDYQRMPASKVEAELAYARRGRTRWTQPALWYSYEFPAKKPLMTVIALDSNVPGGHETANGIDFTLTPAQYAEQMAWLRAELAKPRKTPFLTVMGHHPVYSNGPHGDHPTLVRDWAPLFRQHGVHLYLAGHDHDLQHLELEGHPTSFVCSGAGGADLYTLKIAESERGPFAEKVYGFSHLELTPERFTVRHIDSEGSLLHTFSKTRAGIMSEG